MSIAVTTQIICFSVLSLVVIIGELGVILLENIVYSAFLLGGVFMSVAGLYLLLNASFVAAAQVLVYVGAVYVLIIFAIMLVNKKEDLKAIENIKSRRITPRASTITTKDNTKKQIIWVVTAIDMNYFKLIFWCNSRIIFIINFWFHPIINFFR